jgi:murein DD-endopeptidase MepM/ murein hydrolase activator NlpD/beta-lactamase regulating signal transducer with metallopeptidase domain
MMADVFYYLLKSTVVSGLFYLVYRMTLKKESFFNISRFYLLGSFIFACSFPFIKVPVSQQIEEAIPIIPVLQASVNYFSFSDEPVVPKANTMAWQNISAVHLCMWVMLLLVSSVFLFRFFKHLFQLIRKITSNERIKYPFYTLVLMHQHESFSFFRYVFISPFVWCSSKKYSILRHELSHIRYKHSIDRLFMEVMTIVFWMNPFIYLYRKELEEVHEFQADRDATRHTADKAGYFNLVLQQASGQFYSPLMSPFSYQLIKKRIVMSTHTSHPRKKMALLIPILLGVLIVSVSGIVIDQSQEMKTGAKKVYTWPQESETQGSPNYLLSDPVPEKTDDAIFKSCNQFRILINSKGFLLMNDKPAQLKEVKPALIQFLTASEGKHPEHVQIEIPLLGTQKVTQAIVVMMRDRATPQDKADALLNEVVSIYQEVRNKAALTNFSKAFESCDDEHKDAIRRLYPQRIQLNAPRKNGNVIVAKEQSPVSFILPINPDQITTISGYGKRIHPIYKVEKFHNGIDYVASLNTPVVAISDGIIREVKQDFVEGKGYGRYVIIDHAGGFSSLYAQLNGYNVMEEQFVKQGAVIGYVGESGLSTAPHLHLELKKEDQYVNPANYISK